MTTLKIYSNFKVKHSDTIILIRTGVFYEAYYDDAKIVSEILKTRLTSRNKNSENPIPMTGFPFYKLDNNLSELIKAGYKVAVTSR